MSNTVPHRSRIGGFATGAFTVSAAAWLVVQAVGTPTVSWWKALVVPGFVVAIPLLATAMWRADLRTWRRIRLFPPGSWRPWAVGVLALFAVLGLARSFDGRLNVVHQDGGYFFSNHGDLTPATLRDWQRSEASLAGLFASMALLFNGLAALTLTQVRRSGGATAPRFRPPRHWSTGLRRTRG